MSDSLPVKSQIEAPLQTGKWLRLSILIDFDEMTSLLQALENFQIFLVSGVTIRGEGKLEQSEFLNCYYSYIEALKSGQLPTDSRIRSYFASAFTTTPEALYALYVGDNKQLVKISKPIIQLQSHQFSYSESEGKFRPNVWGPDSISWGIQFSYPQMYQDDLMQIKRIKDDCEFPNTSLFRHLQLWVRKNTVATPFLVNGRRICVPFRLGKRSFAWINNHPQLIAKGLQVLPLPYSNDTHNNP